MKKNLIRPIALAVAVVIATTSMTGCGTMTGIPSHGGGKRFAVEQRLVSASIRSTLMDIDVSPLKGQKVAVVFDIIADEGGGSLVGGRMNVLAGLTSAYVMSPVTASNSQFQVFNLADSGTNFQNQISASTTNSAGTSNVITNSSGTNTQGTSSSGTSNSMGSGTNSSIMTGTNSGTSSGTNTGSSTGSGSGTSTTGTVTTNQTNSSTSDSSGTYKGISTGSGTTTTATGVVTTNQTDSSASNSSGSNRSISIGSGTSQIITGPVTTSQTSSNTLNSSGINTETNSGTSNAATAGSSTSTGVATNTGTQNSSGTNTQRSTSDGTNAQNTTGSGTQSAAGGNTGKKEVVSPTPSATQSQTTGHDKRVAVSLNYQGLGEYQNFNVPKSDATFLIGLVRNYLLLNGVIPTVPTDQTATAVLYVMVDIFGMVRSRFDIYVFNQENVKAETSIEMMAFDRTGKMIMKPQNANREAKYDENYFFWAGPFKTEEEVRQGKGLLVNFEKVDGKKATHDSTMQRFRWEGNAR